MSQHPPSVQNPTEQKLHAKTGPAICERQNMKTCSICHRPMVAASTYSVCGHCSPSAAVIKMVDKALGITEQSTRNGDKESLAGDMTQFQDVAPTVRGMALYAMKHADAAAVMAAEISGKRFSPAGHRGKFWPGAEDTHVNYRPKTVGGLI